jgi:phage shock protein PspC (stress-responsive transcriptional regulator)
MISIIAALLRLKDKASWEKSPIAPALGDIHQSESIPRLSERPHSGDFRHLARSLQNVLHDRGMSRPKHGVEPMSAYQVQTDAPAAKDNLLGICHAIGHDFGFNPIFLRIPLAVGIVFSAKWTLTAYAAMGVIVLASRLLIRKPKATKVAAPVVIEAVPATREAQPAEEMAIAA